MNKATFLTELEKQMKGIPQLEKERIMNYYNETIEDAMEDGMSEEDVICSLGEMTDIIKQIRTEHQTIPDSPAVLTRKKPYLRYVLLFFTCPFWLTAAAMLVTLYLMYISVVLMIASLVLGVAAFFLAGCINIAGILSANLPSGIVLIGCLLICLGILPWIYRLLIQSIYFAKILFQKGIHAWRFCWRKVVA